MCAIVLHARVYDDFERLRFPIVRTEQPASLGSVAVTLPDLSRLSGQPAAIILRLANNDSALRVVRIAIGGATLADVPLAPGRQVRVDLSLPDGGTVSEGDRVEATSDGDGWSLTSLEVANIHGFSQGLVEFVVVPASARTSNRLSVLVTLLASVILLVLPVSSFRAIKSRVFRTAHMVMAPLVVLFLTAVLVAPWVSDYSVFLATHTFLFCTLGLYYPALARMAAIVRHSSPTLRRAWVLVRSRRIQLLYLVSLVLFIASIAGFHEPEYGLTSLIRFGDQFQDQALPAVRAIPHHVMENSSGYDGQFYAQLAIDPLLLDPAIDDALDVPTYRARRILFSWTAFLLGLGQPRFVLHAYAMQNILFWLLLGLLLSHWFPRQDFQSFCLWFGCMFSHGAIISVRWALPDGPSMLLLALAVLSIERGRSMRATCLVGLSGLAKDINLLWTAVLFEPHDANRPKWPVFVARALLVTGPLSLWMLYLWIGNHEFRSIVGNSNFAAPFTGYVAQWSTTLSELREDGWASFARFSLLTLVSLTTQFTVLLSSRAWNNPWWRTGVASCVLMVFLGPAVWQSYPGAVTRVLLPMTFAFNIVLSRNRWFWPLFVLGNLTILPALHAIEAPFLWQLI